jgi:FkbM family methyltransferase
MSNSEEAREFASEQQRRRTITEGKTGELAVIGEFDVFVDDKYSEAMRQYLYSGHYEDGERVAIASLLKPTDRVLEAGTGVGVVSMTAAAIVGANRVVTFEGNPAMVEAARDNFQRNGFEGIRVNLRVLANRTRFSEGTKIPFYVSRDFWASRLRARPENKNIVETVEVPTACFEDEIRKLDANVILCDIEGGEIELFDGADLSGVDLIILETHNFFVGEAATGAMIKNVMLQGFSLHQATTANLIVLWRGVPAR